MDTEGLINKCIDFTLNEEFIFDKFTPYFKIAGSKYMISYYPLEKKAYISNLRGVVFDIPIKQLIKNKRFLIAYKSVDKTRFDHIYILNKNNTHIKIHYEISSDEMNGDYINSKTACKILGISLQKLSLCAIKGLINCIKVSQYSFFNIKDVLEFKNNINRQMELF